MLYNQKNFNILQLFFSEFILFVSLQVHTLMNTRWKLLIEALLMITLTKCVPENIRTLLLFEIEKCFFKTDYRLMQVKSSAECSKRAFCNTFDIH